MTAIHTPRLVLRPYRPDDWPAFRSLVQDGELMWRLSGALTSESARKLLNRLVLHDAASGLLGWAVTTKQDGEYCGHVFIHNYVREARSAELGFVLLKAFHGHGLATEAASAAREYARAQLGCSSISASVDGDNERSKAVLARIGMTVVSREVDDDGEYLVCSDAPRDAFEVQPLSPADAEVISRWRYAGPHSVYDATVGREPESVRYMLDPSNGFHAVRGRAGLIGFCSFGIDGRVPGGAYDDDALDVGVGMSPELVGRGHGRAFLGAVVRHATLQLHASMLRTTIASWNERALRAARGVGFRPASTFRTERGTEFTILLREASRA